MVGQFSLCAVLAVAAIAGVAYAKPPQKIVGGEFAAPGEFPYMVSLRVHGQHHCGGAIVSDRHIVTAAHCVANLDVYHDLVVVTGSLSSRTGGQSHIPKIIFYHHEYTHTTDGPNDIALIALHTPIVFNAYQNKINVPSAPTPTGAVATVTGWGYTSAEVPVIVDGLRKLQVSIISPEDCQQYQQSILYTHQICTFAGPGRGTCAADSGGPLVANGELIGVVSYGVPCSKGVPDVFSSVYHYSDWIRSQIVSS